MSRYVLGIDAGTESIRAAVVDDHGRVVGAGSSPVPTTRPHPGWAEQSVSRWETALLEAVTASLVDSGVGGLDIGGISADGTTSTVVLMGNPGEYLRDAILWMDLRSSREARIIQETEDPALRYVGGGPVSAEWFPCKMLWLKDHEPLVYDRAKTVFELTDWLVYRLTGEVTTNINTASMRWFYDGTAGGLPESMYRAARLGSLLPKLPARVLRPGEVAGELRRDFALAAGLMPGTVVAAGGGDAPVGLIGMGAINPGMVGLITGSSHVHLTQLAEEIHTEGLFGSYPNAIVPGMHLLEGGQTSTGAVLRWFGDNFVNVQIAAEAERRGIHPFDLLGESAANVPPGAEGLVVLEHFQGNRTPWTDATSRGVIRGLSLSHGPAHLFRALMEGVAYGTAVIVDRMVETGVPVEQITICGGTTRSELWTQIHADATGVPILIPEEQEAPLLGSAVLAAVGAGWYDSIQEAVSQMVRVSRRVDPDPATNEVYREYITHYLKTYESLKDDSSRLVGYVDDRVTGGAQ